MLHRLTRSTSAPFRVGASLLSGQLSGSRRWRVGPAAPGFLLPFGRPVGACRFLRPVPPCHPLVLPVSGSLLDEASSRIHLHSPVRSSPACNPRMGRGPLGLGLRVRTRGYPRRTLRWGQALHTGLGPTLRYQSSLLWWLPLLSSGFTSHMLAATTWGARGSCVPLFAGLWHQVTPTSPDGGHIYMHPGSPPGP